MSGIEVEALVKRWDGFRAVDDVTFSVPEGTLTVLLGPSGCGKSTILRMIAGLEDVTEGRIRIGERDVTWLDPAKRGVSMVFQSYALFPHLNVRENILFGLKVRGLPAAERNSRLSSAAEVVGLSDLLDRKPANLSGGQRQRVALARTIVAEQPVCLMDEPLSNLDAKLRAEMREEIRALQQRLGMTMVYVTHDQIEAMTMADQVVLLNAGRIEQFGSPHDLYALPETTFAAHFIGSPPMNLLELARDSDGARLDAHEQSLAVASAAAGWTLGVRPEQVEIGETGLPARVVGVDYLGAETVLRLDLGGRHMLSRSTGWTRHAPGDRVRVSWPPEAVHLFDEQGCRRDGHQAVPSMSVSLDRGERAFRGGSA